ncbi:MAG TPA: hypothetical protein QF355_09275 [Candidatus Marinimicrobia bacterium]|jgi:hypothetical protein|nr:hypothetical protein [Candidatus Neomarinimicrobiota bacterium]MDP6143190.1 hypothetical protein [Candidatus Neomarinimicrobiota bacterium]MDP6260505.1 hypothetical protein [Candidatus Neomarinimicrobiota bacterium]MDP7127182.1 hypothetical protein [Candidatus Neomarinimicrobiota bacterium]MDP7336702.1 hypothetical protein [Candidatus Neomarinimicrobiota bacterium]|tara:strand:+ start:955 stop:1137 length:183 start_codon:yes stop_codon:yes gene_type:complete
MNELTSLAKLEARVRLLIDELKVAKEHSTGGDSHSVETSNKLAKIEEKIKNIIRLAEEFS